MQPSDCVEARNNEKREQRAPLLIFGLTFI